MPKKILIGMVISAKCDKTIKVLVSKVKQHPVYKKIIRYHKKYMAHDEFNKYKQGDMVKIQENRPISATKRWVVIDN